ncbi:MAG: hsp70 family protein [Chitinispirillales bacterium]|jgi:molecular chaperone DnaK (HSP70)|nr:hsp70 family protein [Chitinispirillales bacterium]
MQEQERAESRYIVGIDLGTTNTSVSFVDTMTGGRQGAAGRGNGRQLLSALTIEDFAVLQVVSPGEFDARELLPSFHYEAAPQEFTSGSLDLPWNNAGNLLINGVFARSHGSKVPGRLIASAKSWLSHSGVDRTAPILPWQTAAEDVEKISPVEASSRFISHIRCAWNYNHPQDLLENQDVVLTVPASFDEVARELTVTAAKAAGLTNIVLLEEPISAFYSWIHRNSSDWQSKLTPGQRILICDIGGGTTDFTLIEVRTDDKAGISFHRIAVGDHLILGGDNLDLSLAYMVENRVTGGKRLTARRFSALVRSCQFAKETLLGDNPPQQATVNVPGEGSSLIGGAVQGHISRDEAQKILLDGFFPLVSLYERPVTRQSGFQEFGLPYAPDAAVTKYLAAFLTANADTKLQMNTSGAGARPDIVLFNGGVLTPRIVKKRIVDVLENWFRRDDPQWTPVVLENERPELAVSRGAAYFGIVRRGAGVRISAGLARSYYIGIEVPSEETRESAYQHKEAADDSPSPDSYEDPAREKNTLPKKALCLVPAGLQEGQTINVTGRAFELLIRQPVEFPLYISSVRTVDKPGDVIEIDPLEMHAVPPIRTVLRSGKGMEAGSVTVTLHAALTEIGVLDMWCSERNGNRRWKLQFDIRSATRTDVAAHAGTGEQAGFLDADTVTACNDLIINTFRTDLGRVGDPRDLIKRIEERCGIERLQWPPSFLRSLWETALECEPGRRIDPTYEIRWLNLLGFTLRPGFGVAVDDWRVKQTWQIFRLGVVHRRNQACMAEWWILWRRIAGGLTQGQQRALVQPLVSLLKSSCKDNGEPGRGRKQNKSGAERCGIHELAEIWRLAASLEHLTKAVKKELGETALKLACRANPLTNASVWSLGRFGSRVPMYGSLSEIVDIETVEGWLKLLIEKASPSETLALSLMQMSRMTKDRYRDIDDSLRKEVSDFLRRHAAPAHYADLVEKGGSLAQEERNAIFGEQLPSGLRVF